MSAATLLLSPDTEHLFIRPHKVVSRCISVLFGLAGCLWLLPLLPESLVNTEHHDAFRYGQYQLYTVLLTLWGYAYRRQSARFETLVGISGTLGKMPAALTADDIRNSGKLHLFEVMTKYRGARRLYHHILCIWLLFGGALTLIVRQCIMLIR